MRRLLPLLFLAIACTAHAQVYRWVDKDGKVHYGDQPPPEAQSERLDIRSRPPDEDALIDAEAERRERLEALDREHALERDLKNLQREERRLKEQKCAEARAHEQSLQAVRRMHEEQADGTRRYFTDEEEEAVRTKAREAVRKYCGE